MNIPSENAIRGKVWKFGDNINTDLLMPAESLFGKIPAEEIKYYCMKAVRPDFARSVKPGDIVVAGSNFGCGSSRPAAKNLLGLNIGCVLADSMGALFYRNAINLGLPVLGIEDVSDFFSEGDMADVNLHAGEVKNLRTGKIMKIPPMPDQIRNILNSGGIYNFLRVEARAGTLYKSGLWQ